MLCLCNKRLLGRPSLWLLSHSYVPKLSVKDAVCSNEIYVLSVSKGHMKRAWSLRQSYWVVAEHLGDRPCGGLVEIGPSRLLGLNAWSLVSGSVFGRTGKYGLVEGGVSLWVALEFQKTMAGPVSSLCLLLCHACLPASIFFPWWSCTYFKPSPNSSISCLGHDVSL